MHRIVIAVLALALTACEPTAGVAGSGRDVEATGRPSAPSQQEPSPKESVDVTGEERVERQRQPNDYEPAFKTTVTGAMWTQDGFSVEVTRIALGEPEHTVCVDQPSLTLCKDGTRTIVALDMTVTNHTGRDVQFFPAQGDVAISGYQLQPSLGAPDAIDGVVLAGASRAGQLWWASDRDAGELWSGGHLRYRASGLFDATTLDNIVTKPPSLQARWDPTMS